MEAYRLFVQRRWEADPEGMRARDRKYAERRRDKKREYDRLRYATAREAKIAQAVAWRKDRRRDFAIGANQDARRLGDPGRLNWRLLVPGECVYCGTPCESWDHVVPTSRGGPNTHENIVPCCWSCNQDKRNRTPDEWIAGTIVPKPRAVSMGSLRTA